MLHYLDHFQHRKRGAVKEERALAQAIVDTVREPLLVLDKDLRVIAASRSFYRTFLLNRHETIGRLLYDLGTGEWAIPELRTALGGVLSGPKTLEDFEVDQTYGSLGRRVMALNARRLYRPDIKIQHILLAIEDVTGRVTLEREHALAHERLGMLNQELTHRVKNNLQSISAMAKIESRCHDGLKGKAALERVSHRIDALGQLYCKLSRSEMVEAVDAAAYLNDLCQGLVASVSSEPPTSVMLKTEIESELLPTDQAIGMGLIVNELVMNALKYAFPHDTRGTVTVTLKRSSGELLLTVADNGEGIDPRRADSGLGGRLVEGFAQQLGGLVQRESSSQGTTVRIILPSETELRMTDEAVGTPAH
jgi:two-component sensor histidine kinase